MTSKNNISNPFEDYNSDKMPMNEILKFFEKPKYIDRIYSPHTTFIVGKRGSGKTMFMRYVEEDSICRKDGIEEIHHIGVYLRFNRMDYATDILGNREIFLHYFIISLLQRLFLRIELLYRNHNNRIDQAVCDGLYEAVLRVFYERRSVSQTALCLQDIQDYLERQRLSIRQYIRNPNLISRPIICDYSQAMSGIVEQLRKDSLMPNVTILFLLDEYENLKAEQCEAVNALLKSAQTGCVFKVFHREALLSMRIMDSNEYLMELHDFRQMDFYNDFIGGDEFYSKFALNLVRKRLKQYYSDNGYLKSDLYNADTDLEITSYLEDMDAKQEFNKFTQDVAFMKKIRERLYELTRGHSESTSVVRCLDSAFELRLFLAILEKKFKQGNDCEEKDVKTLESVARAFQTKSDEYKTWVNNYKVAILYLLYFEKQTQKNWAGWESILRLSNGVVRTIINILYYTFENECPEVGQKFRMFRADEQSSAIMVVAEKTYEDIIRVPIYGKYEMSLIQYFGLIFAQYHKDPRLQKPEVNRFVISKQDNKDDYSCAQEPAHQQKVDHVLEAAVTWGHLLKTSKPYVKNTNTFPVNLSSYRIHPLLCVYFGISWRQKQIYETNYDEVFAAAYDLKQRHENYLNAINNIKGGRKRLDTLQNTAKDIFMSDSHSLNGQLALFEGADKNTDGDMSNGSL